jgi:hypothetical protein
VANITDRLSGFETIDNGGDGIMSWLREHMRDHIANRRPIESTEKVLRFPSTFPSATTVEDAQRALDLVCQAAELIRGIEDRASAIEARARDLVEQAVEKLQLAENRIQLLETERRAAEACISDAGVKIRETEQALQQAELRIASAEAQLCQTELRAKAAETQADDAKKALLRIEDAIRTQLLGQRRPATSKSAAAA